MALTQLDETQKLSLRNREKYELVRIRNWLLIKIRS